MVDVNPQAFFMGTLTFWKMKLLKSKIELLWNSSAKRNWKQKMLKTTNENIQWLQLIFTKIWPKIFICIQTFQTFFVNTTKYSKRWKRLFCVNHAADQVLQQVNIQFIGQAYATVFAWHFNTFWWDIRRLGGSVRSKASAPHQTHEEKLENCLCRI